MRMRVEPCLMMEKIEWYQEVLKLDPDSKVFFPLAKLLRDSQQPDCGRGYSIRLFFLKRVSC